MNDIPNDILIQIDRILIDYELHWRAGESRDHSKWLKRIPEPFRDRLLEELQATDEELSERQKKVANRDSDHGLQITEPRFNDDASAPSPRVVGSYTILKQIGKGGMGQVFLAEQTKPIQRRVALKIIQPALLETLGDQTDQFRSRFEAERQALAMMEHPNIARVYEAGVHEGCPFLAMEFIDGLPVNKYCDERKLTVRERLAIFVQACLAIQHAHTKGVIHRDIKPQNVLVTEADGQPIVKVIDFGLARASRETLKLTDNTISTVAGAIMGTWAYMSPEQAQGRSKEVDTRSDVYSLGVLLYELLTGETPLPSKEMAISELIKAICEVEPPVPSRRRSSLQADNQSSRPGTSGTRRLSMLKGDLDWVTMQAIAKDRERRYQSPRELGADISRHLRNEPVHAGPPSWSYRLRKFTKRNPLGATILISVVLVVLVVGIFKYREFKLENQKQSLRADAEKQERLRTEEKLLSQLLASPQLLNVNAINNKLDALDNALVEATLSSKSIADVGLYKFDLLSAMQEFDEAYALLGQIEPVPGRQTAQLQLRRVWIEEDNVQRAAALAKLSGLSSQLTDAERYFLESTQHREPLKQIPLLVQALEEDPAHLTSRYQLCVAYCLTGETDKLRRLCEISRSVYPASPFFDIVQGFGAAFSGNSNEIKVCVARMQELLSARDVEDLEKVMELVLRLAVETRELEHGLPSSLTATSLLSTFRQVVRIDQSSPMMRQLSRRLNLGRSVGSNASSLSSLLPRWGVATAKLAFGQASDYESLLGDLEELSPVSGDAWFLYIRSMLSFNEESWARRIASQEEILQRPSVFPGLKSEVTYVLHLSRRGLYMENKDKAVLQAAAEGVRSWLKLNPHWTSSRLEISVDTALAAGDVPLAEQVLANSLVKISSEDAAVLLTRMRIDLKKHAYTPALELAEKILNDDKWADDHPLRQKAKKVRDKAITEIRENMKRHSDMDSTTKSSG